MFRHRNALKCLFATLVVMALMMVPAAMAQDQPVPKAEIFVGYSWLDPNGSIPYRADVQGLLGIYKMPLFNYGWGAATAFPVSNHVAFVLDASGHFDSNIQTYMVGPQLKWRTEHMAPFIEGLFGVVTIDPDVNGLPLSAGKSDLFPSHTSLGLGGGGGLDLPVTRHIAIRLFQADYIWTDYRDKTSPWPGKKDRFNMVRLQGGVVFLLGLPPEETPLALVCNANPTPVLAGEPVTVTSTATNSMPKRILTYSFNGNGFKMTPKGNVAGVDTTGLAPGDYPVNCGVTDDGKGKHQRSASAKTMFTVKEPPKHPPVATCQISASQVTKGDPVKVTVTGTNPDNRPLSYSCNASAGRLSGSGTSYMLDTTNAQGSVKVNCTVSDDRGLRDSCSTGVYVNVPPPPPVASVKSIDFYTCNLTPKHMLGAARVDNCAKAILDDVALRLQHEADATAAIVGYVSETELKAKKNKTLAGQRAFNTKVYLVQEKGIDPRRISLYTATGEERADIWLIPQGATFKAAGMTPFDDSKMKMPAVKKAVAPAKKPVATATKPVKKPVAAATKPVKK